MKTRILRWNRLKRRAASLGVDVQTLIRLDADTQRDSPPSDDEEQREETTSAAPETKGA